MKIEMTNPRQCGCGRLGLSGGLRQRHVRGQALPRKPWPSTGGQVVAAQSVADLTNLTARAIFDAAAAGDALAERIVEDTAFYLAVGAMNMMHIIDPDMVAFAGGMIAAGEAFLKRIRQHVHKLAFPVPAARRRSLTPSSAATPASSAQLDAHVSCTRKSSAAEK